MAKAKQLVVCIHNNGYEASLEMGKTYVAIRDPIVPRSTTCCGSKAFFGEPTCRKRSGRR